jgi:hypothetical protein
MLNCIFDCEKPLKMNLRLIFTFSAILGACNIGFSQNTWIKLSGEEAKLVFSGEPNLVLLNTNIEVLNNANIISDEETLIFSGINNSQFVNNNNNVLSIYKIKNEKVWNQILYPDQPFFLPTTFTGIGDFSIKHQLDVSSGGMFYQNTKIFLEPSATLLEPTDLTGRITQDNSLDSYIEIIQTLNENSESNFGNIGVSITSDALPLGETIVRRYHVNVSSENFPLNNRSITRVYKIIPENNSDLNTTVSFRYSPLELADLAIEHEEENLALYKTSENITEPETPNTWQRVEATLNMANRTITAQNVNDFSWWTKADEINQPLPIELTYFKGACLNNQYIFEWETASEINNHYFLIQSSTDGENWENEAEIMGAGFSNSPRLYNYNMPLNASKNSTIFRLVQIDFDESYESFNPIWVEPCSNLENFSFQTINPQSGSQTEVFFSHNQLAGVVIFQVFDNRGQFLNSHQVWVEPGDNRFTLNTKLNQYGVYAIRALFNGQQKSIKHIFSN